MVSYYSKKLSAQQSNWPIHEKEVFPLIVGCRKFRRLLIGNEFDAYTDSSAGHNIMNAKCQKLQRWALELSEYNFKLVKIPGTENTPTDALSHYSVCNVISDNDEYKGIIAIYHNRLHMGITKTLSELKVRGHNWPYNLPKGKRNWRKDRVLGIENYT